MGRSPVSLLGGKVYGRAALFMIAAMLQVILPVMLLALLASSCGSFGTGPAVGQGGEPGPSPGLDEPPTSAPPASNPNPLAFVHQSVKSGTVRRPTCWRASSRGGPIMGERASPSTSKSRVKSQRRPVSSLPGSSEGDAGLCPRLTRPSCMYRRPYGGSNWSRCPRELSCPTCLPTTAS